MNYSKAMVALATLLAPMAMAAHTAHADSQQRAVRVRYDMSGGQSNFTSCVVPVTVDTDCIGSGVFVNTVKTRVGEAESKVTTAFVGLSVVHVHPDGSFEIDPTPFAEGSGRVEVEGRSLRSLKVSGSIPLNDGTVAKIRLTLTGTGVVLNPFSGSGTVPEPLCASGSADISWTGQVNEALATGSLTVDGMAQPPTTAVGPATLFTEADRGSCTPAA